MKQRIKRGFLFFCYSLDDDPLPRLVPGGGPEKQTVLCVCLACVPRGISSSRPTADKFSPASLDKERVKKGIIPSNYRLLPGLSSPSNMKVAVDHIRMQMTAPTSSRFLSFIFLPLTLRLSVGERMVRTCGGERELPIPPFPYNVHPPTYYAGESGPTAPHTSSSFLVCVCT